jgi:hypothetical protein
MKTISFRQVATDHKPAIVEILRAGPLDGIGLYQATQRLTHEDITLTAFYGEIVALCQAGEIEQWRPDGNRCLYRLVMNDEALLCKD